MSAILNPTMIQSVTRQLEKQGWCETEGLFTTDLLLKLQADAWRRFQGDEFASARVGRGESAQIRSMVRSDSICWVHSAMDDISVQLYLKTMHELMQSLSHQM